MNDLTEKRAFTLNSFLKTSGIRNILDQNNVTDVAINQPNYIWVEQNSNWKLNYYEKLDLSACEKLTNLMSVYSGLRGSFQDEFCNASVTLPTGERGQILSSPMTMNGTIAISLRKPSKTRFTLEDYEKTGRLSNYVAITNEKKGDIEPFEKDIYTAIYKERNLVKAFTLAIYHKLNIAFIGGTGSGKTTLSKAFVDLFPANKRYITIETSHELDMPYHGNVLHLFYDDEYIDKKTIAEKPNLVISPHDCIKACMRMKPDHIFVTELRGSETWYYFEALNTDHKGSVTTFHANDNRSSYFRLLDMLREHASSMSKTDKAIVKKAKQTIDIVVAMDHSYVSEVTYNPEEKLALLNEELY